MKKIVLLTILAALVILAFSAVPALAAGVTPEYCREISYDSEACTALGNTTTGTDTNAAGDQYAGIAQGQTPPPGQAGATSDPASTGLSRSSLPNTGVALLAPLAALALSGVGAAIMRKRGR